MSSREKPSILRVTNNILECGDDVYQISNLVRIARFKKEKQNGTLYILMLVAIAGTVFLSQEEPQAVPVGIAAVLLLLVIILFRRTTYALMIETASGSGEVLWSKKKEHIDHLVDLIASVMEHPDRQVNYNVNLHDYSVHETVMGDKFSSIKDAVIATHGAIAKGGGHG
jgi:hypothetical protein